MLFRANLEQDNFHIDEGREIHEYSQSIEKYDVDKFVEKLTVFNIPCSHQNILPFLEKNEECLNTLKGTLAYSEMDVIR